jgi:small-conductance mechanosensitive channel/CRP-like cAMP-binding protein
MTPTPLETLTGFAALRSDLRFTAECVALIGALALAIALRRRRLALSATTFVLAAAGLMLDIAASFILYPQVSEKIAAAGVVLFLFGMIRLLLEAVDAVTRRGRAHFSTIFKDLVMFLLWGMVVGVVLYTDFGFQPLSILTTTTALGVIVGLAAQESLGQIFNGLMLQLSKPFEPGDWVKSGDHIGRVRGIGWRSTTVVTRHNERLEIPNTSIGKEVLINFADGLVGDEVSVGLSYEVPPNRAREVILRVLHGIPNVLRDPAPEIMAWDYQDFSIRYRVKYWMRDYTEQEHLHAEVIGSLWYALRRNRMEIPFPIRTLQFHRRPAPAREGDYEREIMRELRKIDFLRELDDSELRVIVPSVQSHQFGAGEVLVRDGEHGETLFIIRRGTVEVLVPGADGANRRVATLTAPQFFGETSLMTGDPRNATIRALDDVEVLEMNRDGFTRLFKERPDAASAISEIIAVRVSENQAARRAGADDDGKAGRRARLLNKMREIFDF